MNTTDYTRCLKTLADPSRAVIVRLLARQGELCVCELTAALGLAQPTVSRHLRLLQDAGLTASRKRGPWTHYRLEPAGPAQAALLAHLAEHLEDDPALTRAQGRLEAFNKGRCGGQSSEGANVAAA